MPHGRRVPRTGAFPSLAPKFLTMMYHATHGTNLNSSAQDPRDYPPFSASSSPSSLSTPAASRWSPKVALLLELIRNGIVQAKTAADAKVVVFSQSPQALLHVSCVLEVEGIGHARIIRGDKPRRMSGCERDTQGEKVCQGVDVGFSGAVHRFNSDDKCYVFLLHASTAAAGLTLTAARRVSSVL